jgi:hypothetical protein
MLLSLVEGQTHSSESRISISNAVSSQQTASFLSLAFFFSKSMPQSSRQIVITLLLKQTHNSVDNMGKIYKKFFAFGVLDELVEKKDPVCTAIVKKWSEDGNLEEAHVFFCEKFPEFRAALSKSNVSLETGATNFCQGYRKSWPKKLAEAFEIVSKQSPTNYGHIFGTIPSTASVTSSPNGKSVFHLSFFVEHPFLTNSFEFIGGDADVFTMLLQMPSTHLLQFALNNGPFAAMDSHSAFIAAAGIAILLVRNEPIAVSILGQIGTVSQQAEWAIWCCLYEISPSACRMVIIFLLEQSSRSNAMFNTGASFSSIGISPAASGTLGAQITPSISFDAMSVSSSTLGTSVKESGITLAVTSTQAPATAAARDCMHI